MEEPLEINFSEFDEYLRQGEPGQKESSYIWSTAIGLQQVDRLETSQFLRETAKRQIEGEITLSEASQLVRQYYVTKSGRETINEDEQEADLVTTNIANILASKTFNFSTNGLISLHRRIFEGVMKHNGELRKYDITKKEWVLQGDTVLYLNWEDLRMALDYDIEQEKNFSYRGLTADETIEHITKFVAGIWQIHPFAEGNTRTTAVFTIQYLRSLGWNVTNEMFAKYSWYFRNALVRANYHNARKGVEYTPIYLERFFRNLLLEEEWVLKSRYLHVAPPEPWREQPNLKVTPQDKKVVTPQDKHNNITNLANITPQDEILLTPQVVRLLNKLDGREMSKQEIMKELRLTDTKNIKEMYLQPALRMGLIEMTIPDKPQSKNQKYRMTQLGKEQLLIINRNNND